jgi:hypothetical protein
MPMTRAEVPAAMRVRSAIYPGTEQPPTALQAVALRIGRLSGLRQEIRALSRAHITSLRVVDSRVVFQVLDHLSVSILLCECP